MKNASVKFIVCCATISLTRIACSIAVSFYNHVHHNHLLWNRKNLRFPSSDAVDPAKT